MIAEKEKVNTDDPFKPDFRGVGMFENIPFEIYRQWPGLNKSSLHTAYTDTLAEYKYQLDNPKPTTEAMALGTAVHTAILEPEKFDEIYVSPPAEYEDEKGKKEKWNLKKGYHKAWLKEQSKEVLKPAQMEMCKAMKASTDASSFFQKLLANGTPEVSLQWIDNNTGLLCKARIDLWVPKIGMIVDIKTTTTLDPYKLGYECLDYGYYFQFAFYRDGVKTLGVVDHVTAPLIVAIKKSPPYLVSFPQLDDKQIEFGRFCYMTTLQRVKAAMERDRWPGFEDGPTSVILPKKADFHLQSGE